MADAKVQIQPNFMKLGIQGFLVSLITNLLSDFQNSKWQMQYGGRKSPKSKNFRETRAEKNSIGNHTRPESRQESRSARKESRITSNPILFILLDLFIINKIKFFVGDCMQ